jgi:hypothetical protein
MQFYCATFLYTANAVRPSSRSTVRPFGRLGGRGSGIFHGVESSAEPSAVADRQGVSARRAGEPDPWPRAQSTAPSTRRTGSSGSAQTSETSRERQTARLRRFTCNGRREDRGPAVCRRPRPAALRRPGPDEGGRPGADPQGTLRFERENSLVDTGSAWSNDPRTCPSAESVPTPSWLGRSRHESATPPPRPPIADLALRSRIKPSSPDGRSSWRPPMLAAERGR